NKPVARWPGSGLELLADRVEDRAVGGHVSGEDLDPRGAELQAALDGGLELVRVAPGGRRFEGPVLPLAATAAAGADAGDACSAAARDACELPERRALQLEPADGVDR